MDPVPFHSFQYVVECKQIYKTKENLDRLVAKSKTHLVVITFLQSIKIDVSDTFSHIVKPMTIQVILTLTINFNWLLCQLDKNDVFFQTFIDDLYMQQSFAFVDSQVPSRACKFNRTLWYLTCVESLIMNFEYFLCLTTSLIPMIINHCLSTFMENSHLFLFSMSMTFSLKQILTHFLVTSLLSKHVGFF